MKVPAAGGWHRPGPQATVHRHVNYMYVRGQIGFLVLMSSTVKISSKVLCQNMPSHDDVIWVKIDDLTSIAKASVKIYWFSQTNLKKNRFFSIRRFCTCFAEQNIQSWEYKLPKLELVLQNINVNWSPLKLWYNVVVNIAVTLKKYILAMCSFI